MDWLYLLLTWHCCSRWQLTACALFVPQSELNHLKMEIEQLKASVGKNATVDRV